MRNGSSEDSIEPQNEKKKYIKEKLCVRQR